MKIGSWLRAVVSTLVGGLALFGASSSMGGTIVGSPHDFSTTGWALGQICVACHTPHNANVTVADAPLWNHQLSLASYTVYSSPSLNATVGQPGSFSKLCLSCHDGTVALDNFGGSTTGTNFIPGRSNLGTNLTNDHPIGFTYDAALVTADGALANPAIDTITIGSGTTTRSGTIGAVMLTGGKMECSSCHDVHNTFTVSGANGFPLLKVSKGGSQICLTCHKK